MGRRGRRKERRPFKRLNCFVGSPPKAPFRLGMQCYIQLSLVRGYRGGAAAVYSVLLLFDSIYMQFPSPLFFFRSPFFLSSSAIVSAPFSLSISSLLLFVLAGKKVRLLPLFLALSSVDLFFARQSLSSNAAPETTFAAAGNTPCLPPSFLPTSGYQLNLSFFPLSPFLCPCAQGGKGEKRKMVSHRGIKRRRGGQRAMQRPKTDLGP